MQKQFLGVTIPASGIPDPDGDLKIALDTLFNHPNLPPFFCKQMIQHLVTSNPSPTYISNCSAVFKDDGLGVRGNLKAVINEILLDPEARNSSAGFSNPKYGKVREALLRYAEWARAFSAQSRTGSYGIGSTEDPIWGLGQMSLRSPTVFNWFAPGYVPPGTSIEAAGLVGPELQMTNVSTVVGYLNFMQDSIGSDALDGFDIFASYETEMGLAANPTALLDRVNLLLMAGEMDSTLYNQILAAITAIQIPASNQIAINAALRQPRANRDLPHHGFASLQRAVLGQNHDVQMRSNPPPVSAHRLHGLHGRHCREPLSVGAQHARRNGAGNQLLGLQGAGLRLPAGRQRWTRLRHRHRSGSFAAFTAARSGAPGSRLSACGIAAHHSKDSAKRPHLRAQSRARRYAESL